jgi:hypothetical protein
MVLPISDVAIPFTANVWASIPSAKLVRLGPMVTHRMGTAPLGHEVSQAKFKPSSVTFLMETEQRSSLLLWFVCATLSGSCPLCRAPISMWVVLTHWWEWPGTWVPEIERILTELGPRSHEYGGGREWTQVYQLMVNLHCEELSARQLKSATEAMKRACESEGRVPQFSDHGFSFSAGLWDLQRVAQWSRLWLYAWGPVRRMQFARRGGHTRDESPFFFPWFVAVTPHLFFRPPCLLRVEEENYRQQPTHGRRVS